MNELPDGITCQRTPMDDHGDPLQGGCDYLICRRGKTAARVRVMDDPDSGDLYFRRLHDPNARWQRVDQSDPAAEWRRL